MSSGLVRFEGCTHMVSPIGGSEHTLCGVAFDAADSEGDESLRWQASGQEHVDCPDCLIVIQACRDVRTTP